MKPFASSITQWADDRVEAMLAAPRMWGSLEAVELQFILLAELRFVLNDPSNSNPRGFFDAYVAYLRRRYPQTPPQPLHEIVDNEDAFIKELREVLRLVREVLPPPLLVPDNELTIRLASSDKVPSASAVTGYYEEFRRATRAIMRGRGKGGRPPKHLEGATEFGLTDVQISPANGASASALLLLDRTNGQIDFEANEQVVRALDSVATLVEWAQSDEGVTAAPVAGTAEQRTWTALQTMRLVPTHGFTEVEIGGRLLGRRVTLQGARTHRFAELAGSGSTIEALEREDNIRAVDLDRGRLTLGSGESKLACFAYPGVLGDIVSVGVRARVRGKLYRQLLGKTIALVESLEVLDEDDSEDS